MSANADPSQAGFATRAIHTGQDPDTATGATIVPIYQTSTYTQEELGKHKGFDYSRTANPRVRPCNSNLRRLKRHDLAARLRAGWQRPQPS